VQQLAGRGDQLPGPVQEHRLGLPADGDLVGLAAARDTTAADAPPAAAAKASR
jgi:hypothetical protein